MERRPKIRGSRQRDAAIRSGRLAGWLFTGGAIASMPASLLLEPLPPIEVYLLSALGVLSGAVCLWLPWQRLPARALTAVPVIATIEIALVCAAVDPTYRLLYFIPAVYAALALPARSDLGVQVAVIALALLAPALYEPEAAREHLRLALLTLPSLLVTAGAVRYLRESLEEREEADRAFAHEAVMLATRIRGPIRGSDRLDELQRELERERV